jgi:hypothetical protein
MVLYSSIFMCAVIVRSNITYLIPVSLCSNRWRESFGILQVFVMYFLCTDVCVELLLFVRGGLIGMNLLLCSNLKAKCDFGDTSLLSHSITLIHHCCHTASHWYIIAVTQHHTDIWYSTVINRSSNYLKHLFMWYFNGK